MLRLLLLFSIPPVPVQAVELLRDRHGSEEYIFEADQTEMVPLFECDENGFVLTKEIAETCTEQKTAPCFS